jgi:two-component system, sensor histidine kinase
MTDVPIRRVLIAESASDVADTLRSLLTVWGHETAVAVDGPAALELARHFHPDVALLDLRLPGVDGPTLARALRQGPAAEGLVLVALSAGGTDAERSRAAVAGFDHFLTLPVDPEALRRAVAPDRPEPA